MIYKVSFYILWVIQVVISLWDFHCCLVFAEDIVLLSHRSVRLQKQLGNLISYCDNNALKASLSKAEIMVFNKSKKDASNLIFNYKGQVVEMVTSYT